MIILSISLPQTWENAEIEITVNEYLQIEWHGEFNEEKSMPVLNAIRSLLVIQGLAAQTSESRIIPNWKCQESMIETYHLTDCLRDSLEPIEQ